ncbi:uncharacterized protein ACR2FA_001796 [Aphomia sociella]
MKTSTLLITIFLAIVVGAGIGVLIWWLVAGSQSPPYTTVLLEENSLGNVPFNAAFTRIRDTGDMFWWFYPTTRSAAASRPLILWLDGVTGIPPSLLANFGMFGPYDFNMNRRTNSWVDEYNLLFVDAPLGTGFSKPESDNEIPRTLEENGDHLLHMLQSFYGHNSNYRSTPLYIFGEGHGAQLALSLAVKLSEASFEHNLKRVVIGNGIIAPTVALSKLGFYLEELGYVDDVGRDVIENLSNETSKLVDDGRYEAAFDKFLSLSQIVNDEAGAVAVNLGYIVDKLTRQSSTISGDFGLRKYVQDNKMLSSRSNLFNFMDETVAPALGISTDTPFDHSREAVLHAFKDTFMLPAVNLIEHILEETDYVVTIYNGNLDAVSNTPGQLEWVENLEWSGKEEFLSSPRHTLIVNGLVEGYFRESSKLQFYWMNAAGLAVPFDSPVAIRRVLERILI